MDSILKQFTVTDATLTQDMVVDGQAWRAECTQAQTFRLFDLPICGVDECTLFYRARLKTEGLTGRAYLEMWCQFPGRGEFFSKGLAQTLTGSNDWIECETPFLLRKGEAPDRLRLNLVVAAGGWLLWRKPVRGRIWIRDVTVARR